MMNRPIHIPIYIYIYIKVEEVVVPIVTVATFMDVRKFEQILWKKISFYIFFVTFIIK